ncbi:MAG: TonB-dependent receptor plug domain-containing protein [Draconibacterium sp.]|nr:TonB-dependent receptor plug domain-containing protein [Draconibacterium sp.]
MGKSRRLKNRTFIPEQKGLNIKKLLRNTGFSVFCFFLGLVQVIAIQITELSLNDNSEKTSGIVDQQKTVSGTIGDKTRQPLPSVTMVIKSTVQATVTDADGNSPLPNIPNNATLVFSFVGMKAQKVDVGNRTSISVTMEEENVGIAKVVALEYRAIKRGEITGFVNTINTEELVKTSYSDIEKSLQGKVPGLIINDRGGYPGQSDLNILIRGKYTPGNNSPLIIIDGVEAGSFSHLSANDIKSASILKNASAAIYRSRAANGVIPINTKRGKEGKSSFNFSSYYKLAKFTIIKHSLFLENQL